MAAIVAVHCLEAWGTAGSRGSQELQGMLLQLCKFGTIGFYFISGFLLGERLEQGSGRNYLFRRIRNTAGPWAIWAAIFIALSFCQMVLVQGHAPGMLAGAAKLGTFVWIVLFDSTYWFVPNFLFSLSILLLFRRFLRDWRLGSLLLLASLFYGVNIYARWIPTRHTTALFGFIFYQWLGMWASGHRELVFSGLARVRVHVAVGLILITGVLSMAEATELFLTSPGQGAFNTLRISNQLYSLAVLLGLLKLSRATWPRFVDVRSHTFGLYLIHGVALFVLMTLGQIVAKAVFGLPYRAVIDPGESVWRNPVISLLMWGATFAAVYGTSLALSIYFAGRSKYGWVVGQSRRRKSALPANTSVLTPQSVAVKLA